MKKIFYILLSLLLTLSSCDNNDNVVIEDGKPFLTHIALSKTDSLGNTIIVSDAALDSEQRVVNLLARHEESLVFILSCEGKYDMLTVNGKEISSNEEVDFSKPVEIGIALDNGNKEKYLIVAKGYNGIPVLKIYTENEEPVTSKEVYVNAICRFDNDTTLGGGSYWM